MDFATASTLQPEWAPSMKRTLLYFFSNNTDMHQIIFIHDPDFFVINDNPMALPKTRIKVLTSSFQYQRIALVQHSLVNHPKVPCEPRRDYSFRECVRNSFIAKVKCRLPWPGPDSSADTSLPVCKNLSQFLQFEELYAQLEEVSTSSIENVTKCLRPCHYKEYRMVNGPTSISETSKRFSSIFIFWFVSTETLVEEQSLVYPWQSLVFEIISDQMKLHIYKKTLHKVNPQVAEFGGTLGLFIGFNFISLWDAAVSSFCFIKHFWDGNVTQK